MVKPKIVLLIFVSGKVVLTGAKVRQEIYEAFDNIHPILKNFKKQMFWMKKDNKFYGVGIVNNQIHYPNGSRSEKPCEDRSFAYE